MPKLSCKKCGSTNDIKSGHTRGFQRYKCKDCRCQFTPTKHRGVHPTLRSFAIILYAFCGASMGKIAQLFKVRTVAVLKWIRAAALSAEAPKLASPSDVVMIDKMWHFVNGKKQDMGLESH